MEKYNKPVMDVVKYTAQDCLGESDPVTQCNCSIGIAYNPGGGNNPGNPR